MTGLLVDERVFVVQPSLVRRLGYLTDAAVLQQLHYWMPRATAEHDGHRWVYKTADEWADEIGVTPKQVRSAIGRLEALGVVLSCQPEAWKRRKWYRIDYDHAVLTAGNTEVSPSAQMGKCIRPNGQIEVPEREDATAHTGRSLVTETTSESTQESTSERPTTSADADRLANLLADLVAENGSKRPTVTSKWVVTIDRMIRLDGRTPEQVENAIRWCQQDAFWKANVLSPDALRKQYDRLRLQAQRERHSTGPRGLSGVRDFLARLETA